MGLDDDRSFWIFCVESFYVRADSFKGHVLLRYDDTVTIRNADDDTLLIGINGRRFIVFGLIDINPDFLDKRRRYDEEDQHDEYHIEHRCDIDLLFAF